MASPDPIEKNLSAIWIVHRTCSTYWPCASLSHLQQIQRRLSNSQAGCRYHLSSLVQHIHQLMWTVNILWFPSANSLYAALSNPVLYSLPPSVFLAPLFAIASHRVRMCSLGTNSSFAPLSMRIGVVDGISGILDNESHFWWHRNDKGPSIGRAWGTSLGREVKVFSRISASILHILINIVNIRTRLAHLVWITARKIYGYGTSDWLAIEYLTLFSKSALMFALHLQFDSWKRWDEKWDNRVLFGRPNIDLGVSESLTSMLYDPGKISSPRSDGEPSDSP